MVSIVRTIDSNEERDPGGASALRVEFAFPPEDLVDVLRDLRSRTGQVRRIEAQADRTRPRVRRKRTAGKSKS